MVGAVTSIDVDLLEPGRYQPRQYFSEEKLKRLARTIRDEGVVQSVLARPIGAGRYEIVAGERRWRAAQLAGLKKIPVDIREMSDIEAAKAAYVENTQRENLRPIEEARAAAMLVEEFGLTHEEVGKLNGCTRDGVSHLLRLLQIVPDVQELIDSNEQLTKGHAKLIASLSPAQQRECVTLVIRNGWTVSQLSEHCRRKRTGKKGPDVDPDVRALEEELSDIFCAAVTIRTAKGGAGDVVIHYDNLDVLDGILEKFRRLAGGEGGG